MKKYILPFMSIAMLMAMVSCSSSDDEVAENKAESKLVPMTFTATQESNVGTRAALNGSNGVDWQTGDEISVFDAVGDGHNQRFTLTGDAKDGKFSGNASSDATKFTAVYPYTEGATLNEVGIVSGITLPAEQTATADSFDPAAALMMAVSTTDKKYNLDFKNAVSLVKVTTEFACKSIVLSANENIAGTGTLTYNSGEPSINFTSNISQTITLKPATVSNSFAAGTYYMVVPSITLNGFTITFTAEDNTEYTRKSTKSNTFNRSRIKDFGSFATTGDYWYDAARGDKVRADQEVDLGLTITIDEKNYKVIFATSNLTKDGLAENEYDYGDYFAWGATSVWYSAINQDTNPWSITPLDVKPGGYIIANAPLYGGSSYTKYTKKFDVLEADDDAARQILGGDWQIPIKEIWDKLYDTSKYAWSWTTKGGYNGYQVSNAVATKTLFLPAAGRVEDTSFSNVGTHGYYWAGTAWSSSASVPSKAAYCLRSNDGDVNAVGACDRYYGCSVRPVRLVAE
ncbi:hypothetical protein CIK99_07500 [Prevotella sp. P5-92]|uniref:hypothetical protein n=1 Tax=Prevotella sp. P5-92 TaxID=2024222 RepID=UPI000B974191|nr:hypothetical protein [Prevotella sp. P5-92]OYP57442.1 hypothetical protein CIK99_07500 [Prevotella sp. P5-92]